MSISEIKEVTYRSAVVSFIDVLGFKDIVKNYTATDIYSLMKTFHKNSNTGATQHVENEELEENNALQEKLKYSQIFYLSDNVIRVRKFASSKPDSIYRKINALKYEVEALCAIQAVLVEKGVFIRGGISIGNIYTNSKENVIFGEAFNVAYAIESSKITYPIIGINRSDIESIELEIGRLKDEQKETALNKVVSELLNLLVEHSDENYYFIDYLKYTINYAKSFGDASLTTLEISNHEHIINKKITEVNKKIEYSNSDKEKEQLERIKCKYEFLLDYHNKTIDKLNNPNGFKQKHPPQDFLTG